MTNAGDARYRMLSGTPALRANEKPNSIAARLYSIGYLVRAWWARPKRLADWWVVEVEDRETHAPAGFKRVRYGVTTGWTVEELSKVEVLRLVNAKRRLKKTRREHVSGGR